MPSYRYTQNDAREHFDLGRIEPGDVREFDEAPDWTWELVDASAAGAAPEAQPTEVPPPVAEDPFAQVTAALAAVPASPEEV